MALFAPFGEPLSSTVSWDMYPVPFPALNILYVVWSKEIIILHHLLWAQPGYLGALSQPGGWQWGQQCCEPHLAPWPVPPWVLLSTRAVQCFSVWHCPQWSQAFAVPRTAARLAALLLPALSHPQNRDSLVLGDASCDFIPLMDDCLAPLLHLALHC